MSATANKAFSRPVLLGGGAAVARAMAQIDIDVMPVYPITPQTPIIESFAKHVADGLCHTEIINVESEHSAASAAVGSALAGARTMTATSSQGLAYMAEIVYLAAGLRAPIVMAVGNRALAGPLNIHCDHSDAMMVRDSGVIQLFCESAQEAYDLTILAVRLAEAEKVRLPVFVCLDGFVLTHCAEGVRLLEDSEVRAFVGDYQLADSLLGDKIVSHGAFALPDYYYEFRQALVSAQDAAREVFTELAGELAAISGRQYFAVEPYRLSDAQQVLVMMGSSASTAKDEIDALRVRGQKVGLARICSFRPFPTEALRALLGEVDEIIVFDRSTSPGSVPALAGEVRSALYGSRARVRSVVYGLGGRDFDGTAVRAALEPPTDDLATFYLGLRA